MTDKFLLKADIREELGSNRVAKLRKTGKLPAVVYGHGEEALSVSLDMQTFVEELHRGHRLFELNAGGKKQMVLVKDIQYDHLGKYMIHIDLMRVDMAELVTVMVRIELKGTAVGTQSGGIIDSHLDQLEIECAVSNIPEVIQIAIKDIDIGDSIHAGEIELGAGMTLKTPSDALVLNCHIVAAAKSTEELEEEAATAPEIITEKASESEEA